MLGQFFNLLEFLDHVFWEHALADAGHIGRYGLRGARQIVGFSLYLRQTNPARECRPVPASAFRDPSMAAE